MSTNDFRAYVCARTCVGGVYTYIIVFYLYLLLFRLLLLLLLLLLLPSS